MTQRLHSALAGVSNMAKGSLSLLWDPLKYLTDMEDLLLFSSVSRHRFIKAGRDEGGC